MDNINSILLIQHIAEIKGSLDLAASLITDMNPAQIKKTAKLLEVKFPRIKHNWASDVWLDRMMEAKNIAQVNTIIMAYNNYYRLSGLPIGQVHTRSIIDTIDYVLLNHDAINFTPDGIYSVINNHLKGDSCQQLCNTCGAVYHTFFPEYGCPICNHPEKKCCDACGTVFYEEPSRLGGRPRKYCSGCKDVRTKKNIQLIA